MVASVTLSNPSDNYQDTVIVDDIENKRCFTYTDNEGAICEMCIYDDGLCLFKQQNDYQLELHLYGKNYAKITTIEGSIKFDVKVVDFSVNSDILVMHYIVNDEARIIEIKFI